jgi:AGZA family xanthine/uracil permease-like MFS transporter
MGITGGLVVYPLMKLIAGRVHEVPAGMWVLSALSVLFFVFYPY